MIKDIILQTRLIPRALILGLLLGIAYLFVEDNKQETKRKIIGLLKQRWVAAFIFYLAFILTETIFTRQNTIPYVRILGSFGLKKDDPAWNKEIIENILLFVPYTWLFLKAFHVSVLWKSSLIVAFLTSLSIEVCQLFFWLGAFQLADMVHNTLGGMIGCGIWWLTECLNKRTR